MGTDDISGPEDESERGEDLGRETIVTVGEYSWGDLRRDEHDQGRFDRSEYRRSVTANSMTFATEF
jgi:flagellar protein FlaI